MPREEVSWVSVVARKGMCKCSVVVLVICIVAFAVEDDCEFACEVIGMELADSWEQVVFQGVHALCSSRTPSQRVYACFLE